MGDVALGPGEQIVEAQNVVAVGEQAVAEMGTEEAGAAGDEDALLAVVKAGHRAPR